MTQTVAQLRTWVLSRVATIDRLLRRQELLLVGCALFWIAGISSLYAALKPYWLDEYLSLITESAGSPAGVWRILHDAPLAVDPPLCHIITQFVLHILGKSEFHGRLLSVAAYTIMAGFFYAFVRKYTDFYVALLALCMTYVGGSFSYASEDRPYAVLLAAAAAAVYFWSTAAYTTHTRTFSVLGLWLAVATAVSAHWYGFLILVPIAAGQAAKDIETRQIDLRIWTALITACLPVTLFTSLLSAAAAYRAMPWQTVSFSDVSTAYNLMLQPCITPLVYAGIAVCALHIFWRNDVSPVAPRRRWPTPVFVCSLLLASTPIQGFIAARLITHLLLPRYVIPGALGLIILFCFAVEGSARRWAGLATLIISLYVGSVLLRTALAFRHVNEPLSVKNLPAAMDERIPIVISNLDMFMQIEDRAPEAIKRRCVYVSDAVSVSVLKQNTTYLSSQALTRWTALPIINLRSLLGRSRRFYLLAPLSGTVGDWMLDWLLKNGCLVNIEGSYDNAPMFLADASNLQL